MNHVIKYMTDGAFFKLEHKIKMTLESDYVIHDAIKKIAKVLVNKHQFQALRKKEVESLSTEHNIGP
jgi:hypothetical protein